MKSAARERFALVDVLKGAACALIVWHHLVSYGPMVDVASPLAPTLTAYLYEYGRLAVQVFLVLAGFMAAGSLAPTGVARFDHPLAQIGRRYVRLALPYFVALTCAILAAEVARNWPHPDSVPQAATLSDVVIHILMLQDLLGVDAMSAGVWYLAIDLQLFALSVALFWAVRRFAPAHHARSLGLMLVAVATAASLCVANLQPELDMWGVYFFGSYGLGMLAYWAVHAESAERRYLLTWCIALVGGVALYLEWRSRIAVAVVVALALVWVSCSVSASRVVACAQLDGLRRLGRMSYSVFLIHYPVVLVFNAVLGQTLPESVWGNAVGMVAAFVASVAAARLLFQQVESMPLSRLRFMALTAPLFVAAAIAQ